MQLLPSPLHALKHDRQLLALLQPLARAESALPAGAPGQLPPGPFRALPAASAIARDPPRCFVKFWRFPGPACGSSVLICCQPAPSSPELHIAPRGPSHPQTAQQARLHPSHPCSRPAGCGSPIMAAAATAAAAAAADEEELIPELDTYTSAHEAYVYAPLPAATSYGHRAETWNPDQWLAVRARLDGLVVRRQQQQL